MLKTGETPEFSDPYEPTGIGIAPAAMRFLIELKSATTKRWTLTIRDLDYRVLATLGPEDFEEPGSGIPIRRRWTGLIDKGRVIFNLNTEGAGEVDLRIDSALVFPKQAGGALQFSLKKDNNPDWEELYGTEYATAKQVGDVVGMLVGAVEKDGRKDSWCCSGVLLSPSILLTNWHCGGLSALPYDSIWKGDVCPNTLVDLAWDSGSARRQYGCKAVLLRNRPLDFVLIRLQPIVGTGSMTGGARPARFNRNPVAEHDDVFMVHHAQCKPKLVSSACRITGESRPAWRPSQGQTGELAAGSDLKPDFTHSCDTEPGASGAPVFNAAGELIGLHHLGFEPDGQNKCDGLNKAVKIGQILDVIKRDAPASVAQEIGLK